MRLRYKKIGKRLKINHLPIFKSDPVGIQTQDLQNRKHKGVLKIDATCADAEVRYPVDSTLLETACRKIDEYTSKVCKEFGVTGKKTHYKDVRRSYLLLIKQKVKKGRQVKDTTLLRISYMIFWKIGCQGDRMPMYRASAPFLQGDKGDRRVTGVGAHSAQRGDNMCF